MPSEDVTQRMPESVIQQWRLLCLILILVLVLLCLRHAGAVERRSLRGHIPPSARSLKPVGRLAGNRRLNLAIGLPLRNRDSLTNLLQEIYDPASPRYRQFLTPDEFTAKFGPTEQDYQAVIQFASQNGFTVRAHHANRMLLDVDATVTNVERAFQVTLRTYSHPTEPRTFFAPDVEPSLNAGLPVTDLSGLNDFEPPHPAGLRRVPAASAVLATPNGGTGPSGSFRGSDFRAAYVPGSTLTGTGQTVGLLQFDGYYANDITKYASQAGLPGVPLQNVLLDGFSGTPGSNNDEVALDIEMVISMAPGLSKVIVYQGGPNGIANDILNRMATDNLARQLSCSWTWGGGPDATADQIFQQMAAQGQSFLTASGDSDALYGSTAIDFPADSPYVTSVGGTTLTTSGAGGPWAGEIVWNWGTGTGSSGGVSTSYSIPAWQQGISMTLNQGSTTKRNIPDVAMAGDNVWVIYGNGSSSAYGGTSIAAPLWAGFIALVNQQAASAGKPPVGFINPAIYNLGKGSAYTFSFHDVTTGNNFSSGSPTRFAATAGYDLCTGWGSPTGTNFINLLAPLVVTPVLAPGTFTVLAESCTPANGVVDAGETVTLNFALQNLGLSNTTNLVATLQPSAAIFSPDGPKLYGVLSTNGTYVSRSFTFTAAGSCGATITASLKLQDGGADLGTVNFQLQLGKAITTSPLAQNFDGVTAPALPAGWTTTAVSGTAAAWVTATAAVDSTPNAAFLAESDIIGVNALVSPAIPVMSASAQLSFRQQYDFEAQTSRRHGSTYYDGGILEIQIGNGTFVDILSAGGNFASGGYNGAITTTSDNPLPGHQAWAGSSAGWITTTVQMPASAAGQTVRLRWSGATDSGNVYGGSGWSVDTINLQDGFFTCCDGKADLGISQSISPAAPMPGQTLTCTIVVTNAGPDAALNIAVADNLPAGATFISAGNGGLFTAGQAVFEIGLLAPGTTTNLTFTMKAGQAGTYTNGVSAAATTQDLITSNNATSLVFNAASPIQITQQPTNIVVIAGASAAFHVTATGDPSPAIQWFFNTTHALSGGTNATLSLPNAQPADSGSYSVMLTNLAGSVGSQSALLRVLVVPQIELADLTLTASQLSLTLRSVAGLNYLLEYKNALDDAEWISLPPAVAGTGDLIQLKDNSGTPSGNRFYRVRGY